MDDVMNVAVWGLLAVITVAMPAACPAGWEAGRQWHVSSADSLSVRGSEETFAWNDGVKPGRTWSLAVDLAIGKTAKVIAAAKLAFADSSRKPMVLVSLDRHPAGLSRLNVEISAGGLRTILSSHWLPGGDAAYTLRLCRENNSLKVVCYGDKSILYSERTPEIPAAVFDAIVHFGVGADATDVAFSALKFQSPAVPPGHYAAQAEAAMLDLVKHYWSGGLGEGCITPTWSGYNAPHLPDPRGGLWERGMLIFAMDTFYRATGDAIARRRLELEWQRIKNLYTAEELAAAGTRTHLACDDVGWDAKLYLTLYRASGDAYALDRAQALIEKGFGRWLDAELGGGLWYNNQRKAKSLYQVGIVWSAFKLEETTGQKKFHDRAIACYDWMESHLLRPDGLYWCDCGRQGPLGKDRPDDIREAASVSFFGGNMAMGVLHAQRYRMTGDQQYLQRAIRTAEAISRKYVHDGVCLNDRDAWANGTFAADWVQDVLTLPGIDGKHCAWLLGTADSIFKNARTPDGYYGGSWSGPAEGPGSSWCMKGSRPQQIMTSGSSANLIMAAALVEKQESGSQSR
jgi:predicted alpha-1,6-mannanase (GH76 family)